MSQFENLKMRFSAAFNHYNSICHKQEKATADKSIKTHKKSSADFAPPSRSLRLNGIAPMVHTSPIRFIFTLLIPVVCFASCKDDPPTPGGGNEQELITTVKIALMDSATQQYYYYTWQDLDGPGGNAPQFDTLRLDSGKHYINTLYLLDESGNPADSISNEVKNEAHVHQLFYTPSSSLTGKLETDRLDKDAGNLPLGLESRFITKGKGKGSLNIRLSHYDGIPKTTDPSPESDLDIDLPVSME